MMPDQELAQCEGKHRFDSHALAIKVAKKSARRRDERRESYRCKHCGGWHVGKPARGKKAIK